MFFFNRMRHLLPTFLVTLIALASASPLTAAEYFTSVQGDDTHDGLSLNTPFKTIQKGVDALQTGDTLTIAPGSYFESIRRDDLGGADADTTIRAQINGTVLLHGDVPAPVFTPVAGYERIFVTDFKEEVQTVNEIDTPSVLESAANLKELSFRTAAFYQDTEAGKLYITSSDLQPATTHHYTIGVIQNHGMYLYKPQRVIVQGLVVRGFNTNKTVGYFPGSGGVWGIILARARNSTIRHCTAYSNGGGIAFNSSTFSEFDPQGNLIDHCNAYGNASRYTGTGGNILIFAGNHDEIRNSYAHSARQHGLRIYGAGIRGPVAVRNSLAWGNRGVDIFIKGGSASKDGLSDRNVTLHNFQVENLTHSLMGSNNVYNTDPSKDNIRYAVEGYSVRHQEFADPDNFDFRLQATSKFRNSGPDGKDRGPFPYQPNIFYVTPRGSDSADGLSITNAWRTLAHATQNIKAGDTLYLEPGTYQAVDTTVNLSGKPKHQSPTAIRARGHGQVVIQGKLTLIAGSQLAIERITFTDTLSVAQGRNVLVKNCKFASSGVGLKVRDIQGLRLTHNEFAGFQSAAVDASHSSELFFTANVFGNNDTPAITVDDARSLQYCDYNAYANVDNAWRVAGQTNPLPDQHRVAGVPEFENVDRLPVLRNADTFIARGIDGRNVGFHQEYPDQKIHVTQPKVFSVTDTTANIEWATSVVGMATLQWGETPKCEQTIEIATAAFGLCSLTGLEPGKTYYFKIAKIAAKDEAEQEIFGTATFDRAPIQFTTRATAQAPKTYHVAQNGDDNRDGLSESAAFATISRAAEIAQPGDVVLVGSGTYSESVRIRNTGDAGRPITFKAAPGARAELDGLTGKLRSAFVVQGKSHINIDGFYTSSFQGWGNVYLLYSSHVNVSRNFMDGRGRFSPTQAIGIYNSQHVTVSNSVFISAYRGTRIIECNDVTFRNNVFLRNYICCVIVRTPLGPTYLTHNIFMDGTEQKSKIWMLEMAGDTEHHQKENLYSMRLPDEVKKPIWYYGGRPQISVAEYTRTYGDDGLIVGDPKFQIQKDTPMDQRVNSKGEAFTYPGDWIVGIRTLDFNDLFTTDPNLMEKGVGLEPKAFDDFHFNNKQSTAGSN